MKLFGPVLLYDLVRMARRGRWFLLRALYAGIMLGLLYLTFEEMVGAGRSSAHPNDLALFASRFFYRFMLLQFLAVLLLTPAYVGGAIAEEKVRQTMDYLLTTDLRNREIILGKLVSRLASLVLFLLAGVPVLALTQLFGGVSPELLWSGLAATFLTMLSLTSVTLWISVHARRPRDAIILSYFLIICYYVAWAILLMTEQWLLKELGASSSFTAAFVWLEEVYVSGNLFSAFYVLTQQFGSVTASANLLTDLLFRYAVFHGVLTVICTILAAWSVRRVYIRQRYGTPQRSEGATVRTARRRSGNRRSVSEQPMLWKEIHIESRFRLGKIGIGLFMLFALMFVGTGLALLFYQGISGSYWELAGGMNVYVRGAGTVLAVLLALVVGVRAAGSISSERERQTLDGLLASPLEIRSIVLGKWWGSLFAGRWLFYLLMIIWLLGLVSGGLHVLALPLMLFLVAVYATFMASLGLAFAAGAKTGSRAIMATVAVALLVGGGHWFCCMFPVAVISHGAGAGSEWFFFVEGGLTPPVVLAVCAFFRDELSFISQRGAEGLIPGFTIGVAAYLLAAMVLRVVAVGRFGSACGRIDGQSRHEQYAQRRRIGDETSGVRTPGSENSTTDT